MAASLKDAIQAMDKSVDGLISKLTSASKAFDGPGGTRTSTGSNFLDNALGTFSSNPAAKYSGQFGMTMTGASGFGQMVSGGVKMMPDVSATMDRMATSYNASLRATGGMSMRTMQEMTLNTMRGGITSPGSDAMVSGYLSMRGMIADASFGSTYQETLRSVTGAAKYLNMGNERAVAAVEGLTNAGGANNMLRNFGIFTADPRTGKEKTQGQIFQELYGRLTAGKGQATEQDVMESYRRGSLGATLRASGMSDDQQQLFVQYAVERARGNNLDLSDPEAMQNLMDKAKADGRENPNLPGYNLNTAQTGAMQNAQEAYLSGIKAVTPVLEGLTSIGGVLAGAFGALVAAAGMASSSLAAVGAAGMVGGAAKAGAAATVLGMGNKSRRAGMSPAAAAADRAKGRRAGLKMGGGVGGAMAVANLAVNLPGVISETQAGYGGSAIGGLAGSTIGGIAGAAIGQALIPIPVVGALIGGTIGSMAGGAIGQGIGSMFDQGEGGGSDGQGQGTMGMASGANEPFWLQHPTRSARIGAKYGATHSVYSGKLVWPDGHKGIDYEGSEGDHIHAAAPGEVTVIPNNGQLGLTVSIKHSNGKYTFYCHLSAADVKSGQSVQRGHVVGRMGNTGSKSNGVHLHFALSKTSTTAGHENPEPFLRGSANYMDPAPAQQEQSSAGNTPGPSGTSGTTAARGGQDSSATPNTANASNLTGSADAASVNAPGATAPATSDAVKAWSASDWVLGGGGTPASAGGEGGENAVSSGTDYLSTPSGKNGTRKNGQGATKVVNNDVTINLSIAKGTPEEARRFAHMLKQALEDDTTLRMMARN